MCVTIRTIHTKQIMTNVAGIEKNLFDLMYDLKNTVKCSFEFKFNSKKNDILMCCFLPKGYLCAAFVITETDTKDNVAHMIFYDIEQERAFK